MPTKLLKVISGMFILEYISDLEAETGPAHTLLTVVWRENIFLVFFQSDAGELIWKNARKKWVCVYVRALMKRTDSNI